MYSLYRIHTVRSTKITVTVVDGISLYGIKGHIKL